MMGFRQSLRLAAAAAKVNLLPGLLLQCLMLAFFSLYVAHEGTRRFLEEVAQMKHEAGYLFSFFSYVVASALLPEIIRIVFFQSGKPTVRNLRMFFTAAPAWGLIGVLVDFFYHWQIVWFGSGTDWATLLCKMFVDQFLFSPFLSNPLILGWFVFRDAGFRSSAWRKIFCADFFLERVFPVQVAGWGVWIPGVLLIYFMPEFLQIPVAVLIQIFWVLLFTTIGESLRRRGDQSRKF